MAVNRDAALSTSAVVSTQGTPFGCCNLFDICADGVFSLYFRGQLGLLDLLNFQIVDTCYRSVEFISFVRPEYVQSAATEGAICHPCADPNGIDWGKCKLTIEDFGRIGREGPIRDFMKPKYYCKSSPRFALDGTPVASEQEWDMLLVGDVLIQDMNRYVINGNVANCGEFDGLQGWVKTGYACYALDSKVINWNGRPMTGGAGITYSQGGVTYTIANTLGIVDVLIDLVMDIRQRLSWSPILANGRPGMVLVMPNFMIRCLLDQYTCWSLCTTDVSETLESRAFRKELNGGMFGFGHIEIDGLDIPLLAHDYGNILGPTNGDMYLLTMGVGQQRLWNGEVLSAETALREYKIGDQGYSTSDAGRMLWKVDAANLCERVKGWIHPRIFCTAPWAQARIQNVNCTRTFRPISPDPRTSFHPQRTSFPSAGCDTSFP
jgi:hypothetical protein